MASERELAAGRGDVYRRVLAPDAIVVVPGAVLTAEECVRTMDDSAGWDLTTVEDARLIEVAPGCATVVYTFEGVRADTRYTAVLASTYAERDGEVRLVLHQQTPVG